MKKEVHMLKKLLIRIVAAAFIIALGEALLPTGNAAKSAKRVLALIETAIIAEPIIEMLYV